MADEARPWADMPSDWKFTEAVWGGKPAVWVTQPCGEICTIYTADSPSHQHEYRAALAEARARGPISHEAP